MGVASIAQSPSATTPAPTGVDEVESAYEQLLNEAKRSAADELGYESTDFVLEGVILQRALEKMLTANQAVGQVILALMWEIYHKGHFHWTGGEFETLSEWADATLSAYDAKYVMSFVHVVERILLRVHKWYMSGDPVIDPTDPEGRRPLTVEYLIARPGLLRKLKESSSWFMDKTDDEARDLLRDVIELSGDRLKRKHKKRISLPYLVTIRDDDERPYHIEAQLTREEYEIFRALVGDGENVKFGEEKGASE